MIMIPQAVYFEPRTEEYPLGKKLLERYREQGIPCIEIENHNNIPEMRERENKDFPHMKRCIILGVRKTHRYTPNAKTSDFLVPYTSSGCTAMCLYCYLVCHYNKCAYLRLFVNREEMLGRLIKKAEAAERELTFEIGSNSDLVLENTFTGNLNWTIEHFASVKQGRLTLPTKFSMVEPLLGLHHNGRTVIRMSVNPQPVISRIELGTSPLEERITALNQLCEAGYPVGILIAPVIFVEGWQRQYTELVELLRRQLSNKARQTVFFEIIFMTYSYVHRMINQEAFPKAPVLYDPALMTGVGMGKYRYRRELCDEGAAFFRSLLNRHFPNNRLVYIV